MAIINLQSEIKELSQSFQASLVSLTHTLNAEISENIIYAVSPTAKIEQLSNGNFLITITDKNGTTTAQLSTENNGILVKTEEEWNSTPSVISQRNTLYIYSNHKTLTNQQGDIINIPGIKVGDGLSFIIDLPFVNQEFETKLYQHLSNSAIHITNEEREFWNKKVRCFMDETNINNENLIFTTQ